MIDLLHIITIGSFYLANGSELFCSLTRFSTRLGVIPKSLLDEN